MKTRHILFSSICLITMVGCGSKELTRSEAERIIRTEFKFPRARGYTIFLAESEQVRIASNSNLYEAGFLNVKHDASGNSVVELTEKAKPFLLPTSEKDRAMHIQKIKLADEDLVEVTGIQTSGDGKTAIVEFTTGLQNLTPLNDLLARKLTAKKAGNKVRFTLYDDGWRLEKFSTGN